ncbi:hypothetical protein ABZP36_002388 [Zizania latifolia]
MQEGPLMRVNKAGNTPLHEAVKHRRNKLALRLLDKCKEPSCAHTPNKNKLALRLLEKEPTCAHTSNKEMQTPLHIAAREGLADVVTKILEQPWVPVSGEFNAASSGTALHQAVLGGHTSTFLPYPTLSLGLCKSSIL